YLGGGRWVFTATEPEHGKELWVTNGTAAGTMLLKDIYPGTRSSFRSLPVALSPAVNGRTYFAAVSSGEDIDTELWTTDGTPAGTYRLKPSLPNFGSRNFAALNGKVYFTAAGGLWETDGTEAGTRMVGGPLEGTAGVKELPARYSHVQTVGHRLLLSRGEPGQPVESDVWVSDGTDAGTVPLASRVPELAGFKGEDRALGDPQVTVAGGAAYFFG